MRLRWSVVGISAALLSLMGLLFFSSLSAQQVAVVSIVGAPTRVAPGDTFTVQVGVTGVTNFDSAQYFVDFDSAVLTIDSVTDGDFDGTSIRNYSGTGAGGPRTIYINISGTDGVSGSGFISEINFSATGSNGDSSTIGLIDMLLFGISGNQAVEIPSEFAGAVTVNVEILDSIAVTPATPSIAEGATLQFAAIGMYTGGSIEDLTDTATWSSSATSVATVGAATGLATGVDDGAATITATSGALQGTAALTVSNVAPTVEAGAGQTVNEGATVSFTGSFTVRRTGSGRRRSLPQHVPDRHVAHLSHRCIKQGFIPDQRLPAQGPPVPRAWCPTNRPSRIRR